MIRTYITHDGELKFVQDLNVDYSPMIHTVMNSNNNVNGLLITDPSYLAPRPIFRTKNSFEGVNNDPELRKRVTSYFFDKFKDDWIYSSFKDLGKYFDVSNGEIMFVKNLKEYSKDMEMTKSKARFLTEEIFTKHNILNVIDKYVRHRNVNWYDLKSKHRTDLKDYIHGKIRNHMRRMVLD
jgi:hypothetical protein